MTGSVPVTVIKFVVVVTVPPTVQALDKVEVFKPLLAGLARTVVVQVPDAAKSLVLQASAVMEKSVVLVRVGAEQEVAAAVPELVRVKTSVVELAPTLIEPKLLDRGDQASEA